MGTPSNLAQLKDSTGALLPFFVDTAAVNMHTMAGGAAETFSIPTDWNYVLMVNNTGGTIYVDRYGNTAAVPAGDTDDGSLTTVEVPQGGQWLFTIIRNSVTGVATTLSVWAVSAGRVWAYGYK